MYCILAVLDFAGWSGGWVGWLKKSYDYYQLSPTRAEARVELGNNKFERIKHMACNF